MPLDPSLLLFFMAPLFIGCFAAEIYYYWRKKQPIYNLKDTLSNLALALMYQAADILFTLLIVKTVYTTVFNHGFHWFSHSTLGNLVLLVVLQDFFYYCFHLAAHKIRWLWASHSTHHSSTRLNFSTAFRQSMTYPLSGMWLFWLPLALIGFTPDLVLFVVAINLAFQFFVHTQLVNKLSFIEKIFNTPSHHRAHHATNAQYIDKNFAGIFIFWDKLFGTFILEEEVPRYGVLPQLASHNPLILTFHEWQAMLAAVIKTRDLRHLWMSPGWSKQQLLTPKTPTTLKVSTKC